MGSEEFQFGDLTEAQLDTLDAIWAHFSEGIKWERLAEDRNISVRGLFKRRQDPRVKRALAEIAALESDQSWVPVVRAMAKEAVGGNVAAAEWLRKVLGKGMEHHSIEGGVQVTLAHHPDMMDDDPQDQ